MIWLTGLFLSALVGASCAYFFNKKLQESAQIWEEKRHIIKTAESLCDELMKDATSYWTSRICKENLLKTQVLAGKINSSNTLISLFLSANSLQNQPDVQNSLQKMIDSVTGGAFATVACREPDFERAGLAVSSIIKLRLAVSQKAKSRDDLFK